MATDNSEPRNKLILGLGVLAIGTLIGLRFAFQSYFTAMTEREQHWKIGAYRSGLLYNLRQEEGRRLGNIEQAMQALTEQSARPALIAPQPSNDLAPMQGWSRRPNPAVPTVPPGQQGTPAAPLVTGADQPGITGQQPQGTSPVPDLTQGPEPQVAAPAGGPTGTPPPQAGSAITNQGQTVQDGGGAATHQHAPIADPNTPGGAPVVQPVPVPRGQVGNPNTTTGTPEGARH